MGALTRLFAISVLSAAALFAAGIEGIWMGEIPGPNGEKRDLALRFRSVNGAVTGVVFGDEFDLPADNLVVEGDRVSFSVTSADYFSGRKVKTTYTGVLTGEGLELTREQAEPPKAKADQKTKANPVIHLRRLS